MADDPGASADGTLIRPRGLDGSRKMKDLKIHNSSGDALTVFLEPWAEDIVVSPRSILRLQIDSMEDGSCEIVHQDTGQITVWLWRGCTVVAYIDDQKLEMPSLLIRSI